MGASVKVTVPEGIQTAFDDALDAGFSTDAALEAALRELAKNPIVPSADEVERMHLYGGLDNGAVTEVRQIQNYIREWQCRMFLAPCPEVSGPITTEEKRALAGIYLDSSDVYTPRDTEQNAWVLEAYRRGQKVGK
jgi:hypothetical protein